MVFGGKPRRGLFEEIERFIVTMCLEVIIVV